MSPKSDQPSPIGLAAEWVARLMMVGVEMVLFGLGGVWLDDRLHVKPLFALIGFAIGIGIGIVHLLVMTAQDRTNSASARSTSRHDKTDNPSDASRRKIDE